MAHFNYPKKKYMFTPEEKKVLLQIIDLALKAHGLPIANDCLYFVNKLTTEPVVEPKEQKEPKTNKK